MEKNNGWTNAVRMPDQPTREWRQVQILDDAEPLRGVKVRVGNAGAVGMNQDECCYETKNY